jgi:hypothetical protein
MKKRKHLPAKNGRPRTAAIWQINIRDIDPNLMGMLNAAWMKENTDNLFQDRPIIGWHAFLVNCWKFYLEGYED